MALAALAATSLYPLSVLAQTKEVNIYTTREPGLIQPMLDAYTEKTGIKVNSIFVKEGLAERVKTEGANSPADLMIMVDIGNLNDLVEAGITQPINSPTLDKEVPENLRDANHHWTSLTLRARLIYTSKDRVKDTKLTYEDLADPKWKGKVCIRSGKHPYNVAMIAAFIAKHGEAETEKWLQGVKANLARKPAGGDRDVARDILAGICDIGPANSYYVGLMRNSDKEEDRKWGDGDQCRVPDLLGRCRHPGERLRRGARQSMRRTRRTPSSCSNSWSHRRCSSFTPMTNYEYPIVGEANPTIKALGNAQARQPLADRDRQEPQARGRSRRPGRIRQLTSRRN